jgi:hypothetical protein
MAPLYLIDLGVVKEMYDVSQNMKKGINTHFASHRKSKLIMVKDIVCTLASSQSITKKRVVTRVLGVHKQNIPKAMLRHAQLNTMNDVF